LRQEAKERAAEAVRAVEYAANIALLKRVYRRWSAVVVLQVGALNTAQSQSQLCSVLTGDQPQFVLMIFELCSTAVLRLLRL
jgi:hypothetical protein